MSTHSSSYFERVLSAFIITYKLHVIFDKLSALLTTQSGVVSRDR